MMSKQGGAADHSAQPEPTGEAASESANSFPSVEQATRNAKISLTLNTEETKHSYRTE